MFIIRRSNCIIQHLVSSHSVDDHPVRRCADAQMCTGYVDARRISSYHNYQMATVSNKGSVQHRDHSYVIFNTNLLHIVYIC